MTPPETSPSVSILMPVKNAGPFLADTLASIAAQTLRDYELVAVDDGSTDSSLAALQDAAATDPRVRVIATNGLGLIGALNRGLQACRAALVARMDADDLMAPERLALQTARLMRDRHLTVVSCRVRCFSATHLKRGYAQYEAWVNSAIDPTTLTRELYVESPLPHPSVMFRRACVLDVGGYRDVGWPEDYDLWLRLAHAGHRFDKCPETLLAWRDHEERHSRRHGRYSDEAFLRCKAHHLAAGPLRKRPARIWGAGKYGKRLAQHLRREGVTITGFIDIDPKKLGRDLGGVKVASETSLCVGDPSLVVTAVRSYGARDLIRAKLCARGLREGVDFLCAG